MTDETTAQALTPSTAPRLLRETREVRVVSDNTSRLYDTARFEHMQRIAQVMANASLIPDHLKGKGDPRQQAVHNETLANCFILVNQADRWNADPFSLAPESYVARGKLGYQGKLVAAIVNTRANLKSSLDYTFTGEGMELEVTVHGTFANEERERIVKLKVKDAITDNGMWKKDPEQKLIYSGATKWARRHCPEIILGIMTDDDLERIAAETATDVTPPRPQRAEYVEQAQVEQRQPLGEIIDAETQEKPQETVAEPKPTRRRTKAAEATTDTPVQQEVQSAAEVEAESASAADAGLTETLGEPAINDKLATAEVQPIEEPAPWELVTCDGEALPYDDPEDFYKAYLEEIARTYKEQGIDGLNGFIESNEDTVKEFGRTVNAKQSSEMKMAGPKLLAPPGGSPSAAGTLDLDAPIRK